MSGDRFVTIAWVYDAGELALLRSLFVRERIQLMLVGNHHAAAQWNVIVALGGVRLRVREEDAAAALALLAALERTPHKAARYFTREIWVGLVLLLLFFGGLAPPARIQAEFAIARREDIA